MKLEVSDHWCLKVIFNVVARPCRTRVASKKTWLGTVQFDVEDYNLQIIYGAKHRKPHLPKSSRRPQHLVGSYVSQSTTKPARSLVGHN